MKTLTITAAALLAAALAPSLAAADVRGGTSQAQQIAIEACSAFGDDGTLELSKVVADGMGDYLVWFADANDDLTICNASDDGDVYAFVAESADILEGEGPSMVQLVGGKPAKSAERLCLAYADDEDATIAATVKDGFGGYLVWLEFDEEEFAMCNASADGKLYAFENVNMPINGEDADFESDEETPVAHQPAATPAHNNG